MDQKTAEDQSMTQSLLQNAEEPVEEVKESPEELQKKQLIKKQNEHRERIAKEVLSSETSYVQGLSVFVQKYLVPVRERGILSENEQKDIFSNVELLYSLNKELHSQLESRIKEWSETQLIGDIFLRMGPLLKMYKDYCSNYNNALERLKSCNENENWMEFLESVLEELKLDESTQDMKIHSLLIMPVQRIPRYSMLLSDLRKHTDMSHPDFTNLVKAESLIQEVAASLNEYIRQAENATKVISISNAFIGLKENLIQPHRRFIREGTLKKITSRILKTCYLFLFNDILLYSHRQILDKYHHTGTINMGTSWIRELEDTEKVKYAFQIVGSKKTWTFIAESEQSKQDWIRDLNTSIDEMVKLYPTLRGSRGAVRVKETNTIFKLFTMNPTDFDKQIQEEEAKKREMIKEQLLKEKEEKKKRRMEKKMKAQQEKTIRRANNNKNMEYIKSQLKAQGLEEDETQPLLTNSSPTRTNKDESCSCCTIV